MAIVDERPRGCAAEPVGTASDKDARHQFFLLAVLDGPKRWSDQLRPDHDLDGLTLVHGTVAVRNAVEPNRAVEDAAGLDAPLEHVRQQLLDVGAHRRGTAADDDVLVKERL